MLSLIGGKEFFDDIRFDDIRRGRDIGFGERISANVVKVLLAGQLSCV